MPKYLIEVIYRDLCGKLTFYVINNLENLIGTPILLGTNCISYFLSLKREFLSYIKDINKKINKKIYIKQSSELKEIEKNCEQFIKDILKSLTFLVD